MPIPEAVVATPFIFAAMAAEHLVAHRTGRSDYRLEAAVSDLSNSVGNFTVQGVVGLSCFLLYAPVQEVVSLLPFRPTSPLSWLWAFLLIDALGYWRHRMSHRVAVLWALHEVHHQPDTLNLGTAQRVAWFEVVPYIPFAALVAALGVPLSMAAAIFTLRTVYSLFTHTALVGNLGWLEEVLVTPSHHRVHHATNAEYLDTNYGAVLIVWDRLWGTFARERAVPRYGTLRPRDLDDPWACNVGPFTELFARARATGTASGAVEVLLRPPAWDPSSRTERTPLAPLPQAPRAWSSADRRARGARFGVALVVWMVVSSAAPSLPLGARLLAGAVLMAAVAIPFRAPRSLGAGTVEPWRSIRDVRAPPRTQRRERWRSHGVGAPLLEPVLDGARRWIQACSVGPSTSSITSPGAPSTSITSVTFTTPGSRSCPWIRPSRSSRSFTGSDADVSSFSACWVPSVACRTRYTRAIPPSPSSRTISYRSTTRPSETWSMRRLPRAAAYRPSTTVAGRAAHRRVVAESVGSDRLRRLRLCRAGRRRRVPVTHSSHARVCVAAQQVPSRGRRAGQTAR